MSGPKVVRVVTKQERMVACRSQILVLYDAIKEWSDFATHHDALSINQKKEIESRYNAITQLFDLERFQDVQNQCVTEIAFLKKDTDIIKSQAIAKAEKEKSLRRRLQCSAETLIQEFALSGQAIPTELQEIAVSAVLGEENKLLYMESIFHKILTEYSLSIADNQSMTPLQTELSKELAEGQRSQTLADWKITQEEKYKAEGSEYRLDKLISEIEVLESKEIAQPFLDRIAMITKDPSSTHRSLLTDSLILDLVAHSNARQEKESILASMREIRSKLRSFTLESTKDLDNRITKAIDSQDISHSGILTEQIMKFLDKETKVIAGIARRQAVLKSLAELGYEVRENMVTAWAEGGRIVVKKPNESVYGVELGAIADAERIQIQLVSFDQQQHPSKASQDLDRETIWCSEFSHLKLSLAKSGTTLEIEKALPIGAKPLKIIADPSVQVRRDQRVKVLAPNEKVIK